ncbi:MAG: type II toxin-antitoxin system VapC family toxin [Armatimonadetes bacterium]|nr:type II toxin-antitoxin system VapC family toxin [Armatimonadota bacterium]
MTLYYLDASAWVKRYAQEAGTAWLAAFLGQGRPAACSVLGIIEVTATLARQHRAGQLSADALRQKVDDLERDWAQMIRVDVTADVVMRARIVARTLATRGGDSVHLATAQFLHDGLRSQGKHLVFIASDHQLLEAARTAGMSSLDPVEEEAKSAP